MSSKAITEPQVEQGPPGGWRPSAETAPSEVRDDDLGLVRPVGLISAGLVIFGGLVLLLARAGRANAIIGTGWASFFLTIGLAGTLFHAALDRDYNYRRLYFFFGFGAVALGLLLSLLKYPNRVGEQIGIGYLCLTLGLLFTLAALRNETEQKMRDLAQLILAVAGGLLALLGLGYGTISGEFLVPMRGDYPVPLGLLLGLMGLVYLTAAVGSRGTSDELGYRVGLGIGAFGALVFVIALIRTFLTQLRSTAEADAYPFTWGVLLMTLGVLYVLSSLSLCSDNRLVVLTRRELGAFFFSPMAYFVLIGFTLAHWLGYFDAVSEILALKEANEPMVEPIVRNFIYRLVPIIAVIFVVPALTMRLLSEERRAGTLEVLLTAPVSEVTVILSKFLAALVMYLVMWIPFGLLLIALWVGGGRDFDYRPLLSFGVANLLTGAMFVSMGLFFSSLTRNQIASGILTFVAMMVLLMIHLFLNLVRYYAQRDPSYESWIVVLQHISFVDLWVSSLQGRLVLRWLLFPISMTIWWLFLSVKVLEARKWS